MIRLSLALTYTVFNIRDLYNLLTFALGLLSPIIPLFYVFVIILAGRTSVLNTFFLSFDFQLVEHKGNLKAVYYT
jgi:hypothetical protein